VIRLQFDASGAICGAPETVCNPVTLAPGMGLDGQKADAAAVDPTSGALYVGFLARNATAPTQIARILNPAGPIGNQIVEFVAKTTRQRPVYGLGVIGAAHPAGRHYGTARFDQHRGRAVRRDHRRHGAVLEHRRFPRWYDGAVLDCRLADGASRVRLRA
jgi:hypothetical protein